MTKQSKKTRIKETLREYIWLSRYSRQYKAEMLWYIGIGLLGTAVSLLGSILSKHIIDAVTGFQSSGILLALVFFVLMQLLQIGIQALSGHISTGISIRVNQQITAQVYDKLLSADWEALSAYHSGDLLTRILGDVGTVSSSVLSWLPALLTRLLQFVGTLALILYYDATLALLALLSAPVTLLISRTLIGKMRKHNQKMRQFSSEMTVFNEESFQNMQLIKSFDSADAYSQKHRQLQQKYRDASMDYNRFSIGKNALLSLVGTVVAVVCFSWGIYRLWTGHITYGTMTLFLQLSASLAAEFSALAGLIPGAVNAATAAGRIMSLMELPSEDRSDAPKAEVFMQQHTGEPLSVVAEGLSYHYDHDPNVLTDTAFQAEGGQIVTFVGPSGEGKTTLLRLLLGIIRPKEGQLQLVAGDGSRLDISPASRKLFSYVPQGNTMFTGTVAENLRLAKPNATDEQLYEALRFACADSFITPLPRGLHTPIREQGGGFSEGQLQRLCIARALLSDAPVLLLDEATSALDIETERQVLQNIMAARKGRTCIITTHRPSVLEVSHRIYRICGDRIQLVK